MRVTLSAGATALLSYCGIVLAAPTATAATHPADLCLGDPCIISRPADLEGGPSVSIDFGDVAVIIEAVLDNGETDVTLVARSLWVRGSGQLRGEADFTIRTQADTRLEGQRATGTVRLSGDGLALTVAAGGHVVTSGGILLNGDDADADGGTLTIESGGDVTLRQRIEARAGNFGEGGALNITAAGDVIVATSVDLTGGEFGGGTLEIRAGGSASVAEVSVDGTGELGDGGTVDVVAGDNLIVTGPVNGRGSSAEAGDCGDGGSLDLTNSGDLIVSGVVDFRAREGDCCGGTLEIDSGAALIVGDLLFRSDGNQGCGGDVSMDIKETFNCRAGATIDASGSDGGGDIRIITLRDLLTGSDCTLDARGRGGSIDAQSHELIRLDGSWIADDSVESSKPRGIPVRIAIEADACDIAVGAQGTMRSGGSNTGNRLRARKGMTITGELSATSANVLVLPVGVTPIVSGNIQPAITTIEDETLPLTCPTIPPPTATAPPTSTPTPPPTSTFTPTAPPTFSATTPPTATSTATDPPATATPPASSTPSNTNSPTPSPTADDTPVPCGAVCAGDCDSDCRVTIGELVRSVQISLGNSPLNECLAIDGNTDGRASIAELIGAVSNALNLCPNAQR